MGISRARAPGSSCALRSCERTTGARVAVPRRCLALCCLLACTHMRGPAHARRPERAINTPPSQKKLFLSSLSHTQKGPRDASEAVPAGGPLRAGATATCTIHDLEWPPSRPERILPGHFGPAGAPRGGRRHAASIWGPRRPLGMHGRVAPRPTVWRHTDALGRGF